jgi:CubicO group peptidase (beta-lactamase class C family)
MPIDLQPIIEDLQARMERVEAPGAAITVIADGRVVLAEGYGITSVGDSGLTMTADTIARAASISKSLTATMVMRLVDRGQLDLARPVIEYLPALRLSLAGAAERVTLRMLLSHTGGLSRDVEWWGSRDFDALAIFVRDELPNIPMAAPPGVVWSYSNSGICLAAHVAEVVTGRLYPELMSELLFDPLGMTRSTFDLSVAATYRMSQSHRMDPAGNISVDHRQTDAVAFSASGGVMTTTNDLARYLLLHMNGGEYDGARILSEAAVAAMHAPAIDRHTTAGDGYGLGFYTGQHRGQAKVWHWGRTLRNGGLAITIPEAKVGLAVLYNRQSDRFDGDGFAANALDVLLGEAGARPVPPPAPGCGVDWTAWAGSYVGSLVGLVELSVAGDRFQMDWNGIGAELTPRGDLLVGTAADGAVVTVGAAGGAGHSGEFLMVNGTAARRWEGSVREATAAELAPYVGHYGLFDRLLIAVDGDRLIVDSETHGKRLSCLAIGPRRFACAIGTIEFPEGDYDAAPALKFAEFANFNRRG